MADPTKTTPGTPGTPTAALAPEEWAQVVAANHGDYNTAILAYGMANSPELYAGRRHALAALCLYQQPFGFTHAELKALTLLVNAERPLICSDDAHDETDYEPLAASAVAKIRALLPEEPR